MNTFLTRQVTISLILVGWVLLITPCTRAQEKSDFLDLQSAVQMALEKNPAIAAQASKVTAEHAAISSQYSLEDPMFGFDYEQNLSRLQIEQGPMKMWSLSQNILFPAKYFQMGSLQKIRTQQAETELSQEKLMVRQKAISAYYRTFNQARILSLLKANLESARKTARTAELKHSTGQVPQQDEMKAHVEETRINGELLLAEEDYQAALSDLQAILGDSETSSPPTLPIKEITVPRLTVAVSEIPSLAQKHARSIQNARLQLEEAQSRKTLAGLNYLPDFRLNYKKVLGNSSMFPAMANAYALGIEMSIPLWFAFKQSSEYSSAKASFTQAEHQFVRASLEIVSKARSLAAKAKNHQTLLEIDQTSLIPQARATLNSSEAAYRAGKISLLELLDSQRALYETQMAYYRTLTEYTDVVSELESLTGVSVSQLPFPPETL